MTTGMSDVVLETRLWPRCQILWVMALAFRVALTFLASPSNSRETTSYNIFFKISGTFFSGHDVVIILNQ